MQLIAIMPCLVFFQVMENRYLCWISVCLRYRISGSYPVFAVLRSTRITLNSRDSSIKIELRSKSRASLAANGRTEITRRNFRRAPIQSPDRKIPNRQKHRSISLIRRVRSMNPIRLSVSARDRANSHRGDIVAPVFIALRR